jgi:hypothetical protein
MSLKRYKVFHYLIISANFRSLHLLVSHYGASTPTPLCVLWAPERLGMDPEPDFYPGVAKRVGTALNEGFPVLDLFVFFPTVMPVTCPVRDAFIVTTILLRRSLMVSGS